MVKGKKDQIETLSKLEHLLELENQVILSFIKNGMKVKINQGVVLPIITEFNFVKTNYSICEMHKKIKIYYILNQCIIERYKSYFKSSNAFLKQSILGFNLDSEDINLFFYNQKKYFNVINLKETKKLSLYRPEELGTYLKKLKIF